MKFKILTILILLSKKAFCFDSKDEIYNEEEARMLFELAAGTMQTNKTSCILSSSKFPGDNRFVDGFEVTCDILTGSCAGYVVEIISKKQLVVAFRPTDTFFQFSAEIFASGFPDTNFYDIGEAAFYFNQAFKTVWPMVKHILTRQDFKNHDVYFIGHSLGGSIASLTSLATIIEKVRKSNQVKVVTFGQPRTGNNDYVKYFNKLVKYSFRIINGGDVLARAPPCFKDMINFETMRCDPFSNGPKHHKTEVWYPDGMREGSKYIVCSDGENDYCGNSYQIDFHNFAGALMDHRKYFDKMISS